MVQQSEGAAIQCVAGNDLVTGLNRTPQSGGDSAHAGSGSQSSLAALQSRQLLLDLSQRGVAQTGVDVALFLTGKAGTALLHGIKLEGRGLIDRGAQRADTVIVLTGVNLTSSKAHFLAIHKYAILSFLGRQCRQLLLSFFPLPKRGPLPSGGERGQRMRRDVHAGFLCVQCRNSSVTRSVLLLLSTIRVPQSGKRC